mgnify:CR=1 FL=1
MVSGNRSPIPRGEPASASPAGVHNAGDTLGSTIKIQRTAEHLLTACLTQGDNPNGFKVEKFYRSFNYL